MDIGQKYNKLLEIAAEDSSEKRRELLNEVTAMFFANMETSPPELHSVFGDLISKIAFELNTEVRRELAITFDQGYAPRNLALKLANDDIEVAEPILRNTRSFTDDDLVKIVSEKGTKYQIAVSQRINVSETVSDALVDHGNDDVVKSLLQNQSANISENTFDKVIVRAQENSDLHGPIVTRKRVSVDVLNQMFSIVSGPMRQEIIDKYKNFSEAEINAALERAKTRVSVINKALPDDYEEKLAIIKELKAANKIDKNQLPNIWREGDKTLFYLMLAEISGLDYQNIARPFEAKDIDSIAIVCRAKDFPRALFVTLAVFVLGPDGIGAAERLGNMYNDVPPDAASRAIRFMQVKMKAAA